MTTNKMTWYHIKQSFRSSSNSWALPVTNYFWPTGADQVSEYRDLKWTCGNLSSNRDHCRLAPLSWTNFIIWTAATDRLHTNENITLVSSRRLTLRNYRRITKSSKPNGSTDPLPARYRSPIVTTDGAIARQQSAQRTRTRRARDGARWIGRESYPTQATRRRTHEESDPQPSSIASGSPSKEAHARSPAPPPPMQPPQTLTLEPPVRPGDRLPRLGSHARTVALSRFFFPLELEFDRGEEVGGIRTLLGGGFLLPYLLLGLCAEWGRIIAVGWRCWASFFFSFFLSYVARLARRPTGGDPACTWPDCSACAGRGEVVAPVRGWQVGPPPGIRWSPDQLRASRPR